MKTQLLWAWCNGEPVTVHAVALFFFDTAIVVQRDGRWASLDLNEQDQDDEWDTADFDTAIEQARNLRGDTTDDPQQRDFLAYSQVTITQPTLAMRQGRSFFPATTAQGAPA